MADERTQLEEQLDTDDEETTEDLAAVLGVGSAADVAEGDEDEASTEAEDKEATGPSEDDADADPEASAPSEPEAPEAQEDAADEAAPSAEAEAGDEDEDAEDAQEDEEDEEDEDEEPGSSYLFLPGDWYVVHTYAGYENKVKANLGSRIQSMNMEDKIYDVIVPTEEVMELKAGKMQAVQKKVFPGYILVRMDLDDDSWYVVRNTPGVTGFVGTGAKPTPLDPSEVGRILEPKPEERLRPRLEFEEGEVVSVISGAFNGMSGPISEINMEQQKVKVLVNIFGRDTPVELPFDQVAKL